MRVPGGNLLNRAFSLIGKTDFNFYQWVSQSDNDIGLTEQVYAPVVVLRGSIQAIEAHIASKMGLDFDKMYVEIWTTQEIQDLKRDKSSDQIGWNGRRFDVIKQMSWHGIDGWNSFLAVDIGPDA